MAVGGSESSGRGKTIKKQWEWWWWYCKRAIEFGNKMSMG